MAMAKGKLPHTRLVTSIAPRAGARCAHGNDNGKEQTTSQYSRKLQLRCAPGSAAHMATTMAQ
eukprot:10445677-Karenia_brevis.AAC.1